MLLLPLLYSRCVLVLVWALLNPSHSTARLPRPQLPSLAEGGTLWFTDLTVADPSYALPILAGLSFLATIELGAADGMQGQVGARQGRVGVGALCAACPPSALWQCLPTATAPHAYKAFSHTHSLTPGCFPMLCLLCCAVRCLLCSRLRCRRR